jgi:hypothetical protein
VHSLHEKDGKINPPDGVRLEVIFTPTESLLTDMEVSTHTHAIIPTENKG